MATYRHEGKSIDHTPVAAVSAGDVVVQNDLIGVAPVDIAAGKLGALQVEGVFDFPKATGASTEIQAGATVYWDAGAGQMTETSTSNTLAGKAVATAGDNADTVRVKLSP